MTTKPIELNNLPAETIDIINRTVQWQLEESLPKASLSGVVLTMFSVSQSLQSTLQIYQKQMDPGLFDQLTKIQLENAEHLRKLTNLLRPVGIADIPKEPPHPELDRLQTIQPQMDAIKQFLLFLAERGYSENAVQSVPVTRELVKFFKIDTAKAESEQQALAQYLTDLMANQRADAQILAAAGIKLPPT